MPILNSAAIALSGAARRALRARAHPLHPVVMVSDSGLSPSVLAEIERSLTAHELIKIRVSDADHAARERILEEICSGLGAHPVQHIGKVIVVYRERKADPAQSELRRTPGKVKRPSRPRR